jgi:2-phospho-L-lactate guanylyltransferase
MIWAVVPAKLGTNAKERLATVLPPDLRTRLAKAMLLEVVRALRDCRSIDAAVVISRDEEALEVARTNGALALREERADGMNASVAEAIGYCVERGATAVVVAMGDLPLLAADDVAAAVDRLPERGVVLVPSFDGTGTNLVAARPPGLLRPEFGPGSLARHLEQVRDGDFATVVHECPGAALDVDTPADLERLRATVRPGTYFFSSIG